MCQESQVVLPKVNLLFQLGDFSTEEIHLLMHLPVSLGIAFERFDTAFEIRRLHLRIADIQFIEALVYGLSEFVLNGILFLDRNMAEIRKLPLESFQDFKVFGFVFAKFIFQDFLYKFLLLFQVFHLPLSNIRKKLLLAVKEGVARRPETFPYFIGVLSWHRTNFLPLFLQVDQIVGGISPIFTIFQCLSLLANIKLQVIVVSLLLLKLS